MISRKNNGTPKKEAIIDDASLNLLIVILAVTVLFVAVLASYLTVMMLAKQDTPPPSGDLPVSDTADHPFRVDGITVELPSSTDAEFGIPKDTVNSEYAILADVTDNKIIASLRGETMMYPASMTKVMTLIVVVENLKSTSALDEVLEITHDYGENSGLRYPVGTKLSVKDLLHAAILQSDGIACITLAEYIAGSETAFVKLMNEKAKDMDIDGSTVFQNCTGLHHKYHYSTCRDIATIMAYAMKNPLCSSVLTAQVYESERAGKFYNWLFTTDYIYTNQPKRVDIIAGKTGWTGKETSGNCVVTYSKGEDGHFYVSVTAKADSKRSNVEDIFHIYNEYIK